MRDIDRRLSELTRAGRGCFSRSEAYAAGLTDQHLRRRVANGRLEKFGSHTFRPAGISYNNEDDLRATLTDIGSPAWATGVTAAALHGFDGFSLRRPFHVLVPETRETNRDWVTLSRSDTIPLIDRARHRGVPVTSAARTIIQLARTCDESTLSACIDSAIRDLLVNEDLLHRRIVALRSMGRHGLPALHGVLAGLEVTRGGHSWLERTYLHECSRAGLPRPDTQQILNRVNNKLVRVDFRFPSTNIIVEVLGYRWHRTKAQMAADARRYNALLGEGFHPYQFTYSQIVQEIDMVIETTREALATADDRFDGA